ncbi:MAG: cell division protein FtsZ, partial [Oscillospiraceae bacterium]|nr:cell division protein FtsZ [Oscillospiraceae bacterium]
MAHDNDYTVNIKVTGVGGGGGNAVNRMVDSDMKGVDFIAINTDNQILFSSKAENKVSIGAKTTKGDGAGGNPEIGERAAEESREEIANALKGAQMLFITAGMGGGTGTGAAPVVAQVAREMDILTIGVVTKPFHFEGAMRMRQAEQGIARLRECVDSLVVVPNERLKMLDNQKITFANAFQAADDVLKQGVKSISELINTSGFINLDFADVSTIMQNAGYAHMGVASAQGKDKAIIAAESAISSPLLETSIDGAKGLIINITAPPTIEFDEIDAATSHISQSVDPEANIIFGVAFDEKLDDELKITVIATGFDTDFKDKIRKTTVSDINYGQLSDNRDPNGFSDVVDVEDDFN